MTQIYLCKKGYGTLAEIQSLDTPDFLDLVEYENIENDIMRHIQDTAGR